MILYPGSTSIRVEYYRFSLTGWRNHCLTQCRSCTFAFCRDVFLLGCRR